MTYSSRFHPCLGPRGRDLGRTRFEGMVLVYEGKQIVFLESRFGSHKAMGLDGDFVQIAALALEPMGMMMSA